MWNKYIDGGIYTSLLIMLNGASTHNVNLWLNSEQEKMQIYLFTSKLTSLHNKTC